MDISKTVAHWTEAARYDRETARNLLDSGKYPYALFFGHLALEKALKAAVVLHTNQHAPFTHSLPLLAGRTGIEFDDSVLDKLAEYTTFQIEARYPDERKSFYAVCTKEFTAAKLQEMEELLDWLLKKYST